MRSIGAEALADRLDQRFALLAGQSTSLDPRHRSLHQLVEWSYELLDPVDQQAFAHLAAFAGSFDLEAAEVVCRKIPGGLERPARVVIDLVDKSMVQVVDPEEPRYRLLETLRDFGLERLRETKALARVEKRHREWFVDAAERSAVGLDTSHEGRWVTKIDRDLDNFRAPTPAPWPPVTSPSPEGWWPPSRVLVPASALRDCRLGRGHDADGGVRALTHSADRARSRCLRAMGARRPRCRNLARSALDRRRRLARRTVDRPRGAGPRQCRLLRRGDAGRVALDGPNDRGRRSRWPTGRTDARAVHVVGRQHLDR